MAGQGEAWDQRQLFGLPIAAATMSQVLDKVDTTITDQGRWLIGVVNAAKIVNMRRNELLDWSVRSADVILADGMSVVWASKLLGRALPERVPGIDLMTGMMRRAEKHGHRVYFLGAEQAVLDKVLAHVAEHYPDLTVAGSHHGYFDEAGEQAIAEDIRQSRANILFVAITSPKKEKFLARWAEHMRVNVCHGVGGSFDVMAGKVKRAPEMWQKLGLEWLYRIVQEPGRMWKRYLVTNTLFVGLLIKEWFGLARHKPATPAPQL